MIGDDINWFRPDEFGTTDANIFFLKGSSYRFAVVAIVYTARVI